MERSKFKRVGRVGIKEKTVADARKQRVQRSEKKPKKDQTQIFANRYNKLQKYKRTKDFNMEQFVFLPKFVGAPYHLSKTSLSVYPVMCCEANFEQNDWFQISEEHIARMTGLSCSAVLKGINGLLDGDFHFTLGNSHIKYPLLERKKVTKDKRHFYMYRAGFMRKGINEEFKGSYFIFHRCIIKSGVWATLSPRAKALYIAFRTAAFFDNYTYCEIEYDGDIRIMGDTFDYNSSDYRDRKWDVCTTSLTELCRMVHIERTNLNKILEQLAHCGLIERIDIHFKVYLKPSKKIRY